MWFRKLIFSLSILFFLIFISSSFADTLIYRYDELNRLSRIEYSSGTIIGYTYDAVGNRLSETFIVLSLSGQTIQSGTYTANSFTIGPNVTITSEAEVIFDAAESIFVSSNILIEESAHVTFKAESITAENNFIIRSNAVVIFEASDSLIIGPNFTIQSGAQVIFRAGNSITILPEFTAEEGCTFEINTL